MKVTLEKIYPMPCSAEVAWQFLQDIEGVATCMPGASITERISDTLYKGAISVRVGPASMAFKGQITVQSVVVETHTLHLIGKGTDSTGTSGASMDLLATVRPVGDSCELIGKSEVSLNGKAAAFGGRMMDVVAEQILKQFAANFANQVQALQEQASFPHVEPTTQPNQSKHNQLNGLGLFWAIIADWFRRFFSGKSA